MTYDDHNEPPELRGAPTTEQLRDDLVIRFAILAGTTADYSHRLSASRGLIDALDRYLTASFGDPIQEAEAESIASRVAGGAVRGHIADYHGCDDIAEEF